MAKRKSGNTLPAESRADSSVGLRKALINRTKDELVATILELANADRKIHAQLLTRFDVAVQPAELVKSTRMAISDATDFDERQMNRNFDYDLDAYETVKRNFSRMVASGHLRSAMELSLELMKDGSYQVEMSDEGLMSDDIEECLAVVLRALTSSDLPAVEVIAWCKAMLKNDRVGCIAREELKTLQKKFQAAS